MNYLLVVSPLLVLAGAILNNRLTSWMVRTKVPGRRHRRWIAKTIFAGYWTVLVSSTALTIGSIWLQQQQTIRAQNVATAISRADEGRSVFHMGLQTGSPGGIEASFARLEAAVKVLQELDMHPEKIVAAIHDLALGHERLAYADTQMGCYYWDNKGELDACQAARGAGIHVAIPTPTGSLAPNIPRSHVKCTDIADHAMWDSARSKYQALADRLLGQEDIDSAYDDEIVTAARSTAYFFMCDDLRNGRRHKEVAELLKTTVSIAKRHDMKARQADAEQLLSDDNLILSHPSRVTTCVQTCDPAWFAP